MGETAVGFSRLDVAVKELARSLEVPGTVTTVDRSPWGGLYIHSLPGAEGYVALLPEEEYRAWATEVDQNQGGWIHQEMDLTLWASKQLQSEVGG